MYEQILAIYCICDDLVKVFSILIRQSLLTNSTGKGEETTL